MKLHALQPFLYAGRSFHPGQTLDTEDHDGVEDKVRKDLIASGKVSLRPVELVQHDDPCKEFARPVVAAVALTTPEGGKTPRTQGR